jgi:hypothetical protein
MQQKNIKRLVFLLGFLICTTWCVAITTLSNDGLSPILIKTSIAQGHPKNTSIQATINGHSLTVVFTENLGNVQVEVTDSTGGTVDYWDIWTPNGYIVYIYDTGSYVVTFTLPNGDEYYGEFEVTD